MSLSMRRVCAVLAALVFFGAGSTVRAQVVLPPESAPAPAPAENTTGPALSGLRPALNQVGDAVASLRINKWKAPADVRASSGEDVASIQRDLTTTLPPLLDQAQASSSPTGALAPSFTVFRNIDALYDVLLRVTEMANLAGSAVEAQQLENSRSALESARSTLATALLASVTAQDTQLAHFRQLAATPPKPAAPAAPAKIVVDDGPTPPKHPHKKKPATGSANSTTTTPPPSN